MLPKISIITPSFNQGRFIGSTLSSIHNQSYTNLEHIVMDGGSTDETIDILKSYDDRIFWQIKPDNGQYAAIQQGFARASGDIYGWLNSDDIY
jgi:glycosyltransferase involved in cell wall biosynthesis